MRCGTHKEKLPSETSSPVTHRRGSRLIIPPNSSLKTPKNDDSYRLPITRSDYQREVRAA
eukprot:6882766-Pyramimonas_sp.AAC.1